MRKAGQTRYHLVGVGGTGMRGLASLLASRGAKVSGSDRNLDRGLDLPVFGILRADGVELLPEDGSGGKTADILVASSAVESGHPDLLTARERGIPVLGRAEALKALTDGNLLIAVAGTSGKTTTAGMTGWIMEKAGRDPSVYLGGAVSSWKGLGTVRKGNGPWVIETDESDGSISNFSPDIGLVTTISRDHKEIDEAVSLFGGFLDRSGKRIVSKAQAERFEHDLSYGIDEGDIRAGNVRLSPTGSRFTVEGLEYRLNVPGIYNIENALAAMAAARVAGTDDGVIREGIESFPGMKRRMERASLPSSCPGLLFDDFAHNPEKIRASMKFLRGISRETLVIYQPHGYGPLKRLLDDTAEAFAGGARVEDEVLILPIYDAGGTADRTVSSDDLAEAIRGLSAPAEAVGTREEAAARAVPALAEGRTVCVMGARDDTLGVFTADLADRVAALLRSHGDP